MSRYTEYKTLTITLHDAGILEIVMGGPGRLATTDHTGHAELSRIWRDVSDDPDVRVAILRGEGKGFSAGGDFSLVEQMANDFQTRTRVWKALGDRGRRRPL